MRVFPRGHAVGPRIAFLLGREEHTVSRLRRRPDLTALDLGSELILCDERSMTFHVLNDTARQIWLLLDEGAPSDAVSDRLAGCYPGVARDRLERDLAGALEEFARRGLLDDVVRSAASS